MKLYQSLVVAFIFSGTSFATVRAAADRVDHYIQSEMADQHIPGLAVGVYRNGQIIKAKGYGLANVELKVPVRPETIFQSGSIGKQFAATAIMMLVEERRISL